MSRANRSRSSRLGVLAALGANLLFGFTNLFSVLILEAGIPPLVILSVRFTIAFALLNLLWGLRAMPLHLRGKHPLRLLPLALAQPVCYFTFETYGLQMVPSSAAGVIVSLVPVFVLIACLLLGRAQPTRLQILFSLLAVIGVIVFKLIGDSGEGGSTVRWLGLLLLLLAVLSSTVFNLQTNRLAADFSPFERTYVMFGVSAISFHLMAWMTLGGGYGAALVAVFASPRLIGSVLYLAVAASVFAFLLYNYATSVIDPVRATSFSCIIPICSLVAGIVFLHERVSLPQLLCCLLIIGSVYGVNRFVRPQKKT